MMNCVVQNLHNTYALRNTVDYLIAPETLIYMTPGYNYEDIFLKLKLSGNTTPLEVANCAITSFTNEVFKNQYEDCINETALFAVRPAKSTELRNLVDRFCNFITPLIDTDRVFWNNAFVYVYNRSYRFDSYDYYLVDFDGFLNKLIEKLNKEANTKPGLPEVTKYICQLREELFSHLKQYTINSWIGPYIYKEASVVKPLDYYGLPIAAAVYFPDSYIESSEFNIELPTSSSFFKNTEWGAFVKFLYKKS